MYFASTRPGGFGLFDIWISVDKGNNNWTQPLNAGSIINTKANDIAPAVSELASVLFFASDGHPGFGGFDLFVAKAKSSGDTVLYNLNAPFNSAKDDCFLSFRDQTTLLNSFFLSCKLVNSSNRRIASEMFPFSFSMRA